MNILITGVDGQLGRDLLRVLGQAYMCTAFTRQEMDICDLQALQKTVGDMKPDVVINAMAYSKVDQAQEPAEEAYRIHTIGVSHLAIATEAVGAKLVHVSTDYVYDGTNNPLNVYGKSKLLGEQFVQAVCPRHFIMQETIKVVDDQSSSPTNTLDLAECIGRIIATERYGTYHVSNSGYNTGGLIWYGLDSSNQIGGIPFE